jgi:hypothetical protein
LLALVDAGTLRVGRVLLEEVEQVVVGVAEREVGHVHSRRRQHSLAESDTNIISNKTNNYNNKNNQTKKKKRVKPNSRSSPNTTKASTLTPLSCQ